MSQFSPGLKFYPEWSDDQTRQLQVQVGVHPEHIEDPTEIISLSRVEQLHVANFLQPWEHKFSLGNTNRKWTLQFILASKAIVPIY